jgi:cytochrome c peroxidase
MSSAFTSRMILLAAGMFSMTASVAQDTLQSQARTLFGVIEAPRAQDLSRPDVQLGRKLFWDTRISGDGKTSCASCHTQDAWASDVRERPTDARGKTTPRHSLTVFNAMAQPVLRWLGDRNDGAAMAEGLLTGPMGFDSLDAAQKRLAESGYEAEFKAAFPGHENTLTTANFGKAIAAYQVTLKTPAAFDRFLNGEGKALNARQLRGLDKFIATGCAGCHSGALLGGTTLQKFGVVQSYPEATGSKTVDAGRFVVTKREEDRHVFRVPMLRNVAKTGPYFHDGSVGDLGKAVRIMAEIQLGKRLDDEAVADIVAFLESLTGNVPSNFAPAAR